MPRFDTRTPGSKLYAGAGVTTSSGAEQGDIKWLAPVVPDGRSLECCDGDQASEHIEFTRDFVVRPSVSLTQLGRGEYDMLGPIPLYHQHVLWTVVPMITRKGNDYHLSLINIGPHMSMGDDPANAMCRNESKKQKRPDLTASFTFINGNGGEKKSFELVADADGDWEVTRDFTRRELLALADGDEIVIRLCAIIARSYFDLPGLLVKPTTVPGHITDTVAAILRGERTPGADALIKCVAADNRTVIATYHVHKERLLRLCPSWDARAAVYTMKVLTPDEMPMFISLAYGIDPPLPMNLGRVKKVGMHIAWLIGERAFDGVIERWERAICERALAFDKSDLASLRAITHLIMIIFTFPYGAFPVAKRVTIGVFADIVRLNAPHGKFAWMVFLSSKNSPVQSTLGDFAEYSAMPLIMKAVVQHILYVASVRKFGLVGKGNEAESRNREVSSEHAKGDGKNESIGTKCASSSFNFAQPKDNLRTVKIPLDTILYAELTSGPGSGTIPGVSLEENMYFMRDEPTEANVKELVKAMVKYIGAREVPDHPWTESIDNLRQSVRDKLVPIDVEIDLDKEDIGHGWGAKDNNGTPYIAVFRCSLKKEAKLADAGCKAELDEINVNHGSLVIDVVKSNEEAKVNSGNFSIDVVESKEESTENGEYEEVGSFNPHDIKCKCVIS